MISDSVRCVLLDMNGTFMFGGDRFGEGEDFVPKYRELGGTNPEKWVDRTMRAAFASLEKRYPDPVYRYSFPTVADAILENCEGNLTDGHIQILVDLFSFHEMGQIPDDHAESIRRLAMSFKIGLVADIWAPAAIWKREFYVAKILDCFEAMSFSSDVGIVKPAHEPFLKVLSEIGVGATEAIFIGDSVRRDLGGAKAAGINCVLVGGASHEDAEGSYVSLLEFVDEMCGD